MDQFLLDCTATSTINVNWPIQTHTAMRKNDAIVHTKATLRTVAGLKILDVQQIHSNAVRVDTASVGTSYAMADQTVAMHPTKNAQ